MLLSVYFAANLIFGENVRFELSHYFISCKLLTCYHQTIIISKYQENMSWQFIWTTQISIRCLGDVYSCHKHFADTNYACIVKMSLSSKILLLYIVHSVSKGCKPHNFFCSRLKTGFISAKTGLKLRIFIM